MWKLKLTEVLIQLWVESSYVKCISMHMYHRIDAGEKKNELKMKNGWQEQLVRESFKQDATAIVVQ